MVDAGPAADGCELVLVWAAMAPLRQRKRLHASIPVLRVNLGRIGFLAEAEAEAIDAVLEHVVAHDYRVKTA